MKNHINKKYALKDKVAIITQAQNDIGQDIALFLAEAGCHIVLLGHQIEELEDIIKAIENFGSKALPLEYDFKDADSVESTISQIMSQFGQIDYIIHNNQKMILSATSDSFVHQIDDMMDRHYRLGYLLIKAALPFLKLSDNAHIIQISPPLTMDANFFQYHTPFTLSKYSESMLTLGLSYELYHDHIAINSIWPRALIKGMDIGDGVLPPNITDDYMRLPKILSHAIAATIEKPAQICTGSFMIDDLCLMAEGVTDFNQYAVDPSKELIENLFIAGDTSPPPEGVKIKKIALMQDMTRH